MGTLGGAQVRWDVCHHRPGRHPPSPGVRHKGRQPVHEAQHRLAKGRWAHAQPRAARRTLTSAEPGSALLKAEAALVQESLAGAWTGRAARGNRTVSQGGPRGGRGWLLQLTHPGAPPGPLAPRMALELLW